MKQTLLLLILPFLLFISIGLIKGALGHYYFNLPDPTYAYLINSLSVALGFPVGHFDHPGTTVQVIGAIVIKAHHWISNGSSDLTIDVLSRPEEYLKYINIVLVLTGSLILFLLGILVYKLSRNLLLSVLIQLSPFVSSEMLYGYKIVASDNFLITVTLCFVGILVYYLFRIQNGTKSPHSFILIFAIICSFGLATKISFFPLLITPLLLIEGRRNKFIFLSFVSLFFLILVLPAISNYDKFLYWIWLLFVKSGSYGQGDPSVVDIPRFFTFLKLIFTRDLIFTVSYFLSIAVLVFVYIASKKKPGIMNEQRREFRLLLSIVLAMTLQIIIVAKQYRQHYMISSFVLSMFSLSLCAMLLSTFIKGMKLQLVYASIIICISVISADRIYSTYKTSLLRSNEANKVNRFVKENSSNAIVISSTGTASKEFSLAFGLYFSGTPINYYKSVLSTLQRENIFYIPWSDEFFSLHSKESVRKELQDNKRIIFQTNKGNVNAFMQTLEITYGMSNISKKLLFSNSIKEEVYEITTGNAVEE